MRGFDLLEQAVIGRNSLLCRRGSPSEYDAINKIAVAHCGSHGPTFREIVRKIWKNYLTAAGVMWAPLRGEGGGATYNELWSAVRDFREGNILRYPVTSPEGLLQSHPPLLLSPAFHPLIFSPVVSLNFPPSLKEDQDRSNLLFRVAVAYL